MSDIKQMLVDEIQSEFGNLKQLDLGSKEYSTAVDGLAKLVDRTIEMDKMKIESDNRIDDIDLKVTQMEEEKKDRWWKNALTAAGIIIPTSVTIWGTLKTFKFEETGTVTSIVGRNFINKLLKK